MGGRSHATAFTAIAKTDTSALALAAAGAGVALGHRSLATADLRDGRLVAPFETRLPAEPVFHLVMPRGRPSRPEARLLRDWLFETAHDQGQDQGDGELQPGARGRRRRAAD